MSTFEYKVIDIDKVGISEENLLNKMDSEGWELFLIPRITPKITPEFW